MNHRIMRSLTTGGAVAVATIFAMAAGSAVAGEDGWTGDLAVGVTAQSGSVDTFAGNIDATGERTYANDELSARFSAVFGTSKDRATGATAVPPATPEGTKRQTIQNAQGIFGDWKHLFSDRFFWLSSSEVSRDNTQDREVRARVNSGPGYRFWQGEDAGKHHFDASAGVGYRYELYDGNTGAGTAFNGDDFHLVDLVAQLEYMNSLFDDRVEYTHTFGAFVPANDFEAYILRTEVIIGIPLSEAWSFRTGFLAEYVNDVPNNRNPLTTRTTVGIGYAF